MEKETQTKYTKEGLTNLIRKHKKTNESNKNDIEIIDIKQLAYNGVKSAGLGLVASACGLYHGFCDAKNIPFDSAVTETLLTYGPVMLAAGIPAVAGAGTVGTIGGVVGGFVGHSVAEDNADRLEHDDSGNFQRGLEKTLGTVGGTIVGGVGGAIVGAGVGAVSGGAIKTGLQTTAAYVAGYVIGTVFN